MEQDAREYRSHYRHGHAIQLACFDAIDADASDCTSSPGSGVWVWVAISVLGIVYCAFRFLRAKQKRAGCTNRTLASVHLRSGGI